MVTWTPSGRQAPSRPRWPRGRCSCGPGWEPPGGHRERAATQVKQARPTRCGQGGREQVWPALPRLLHAAGRESQVPVLQPPAAASEGSHRITTRAQNTTINPQTQAAQGTQTRPWCQGLCTSRSDRRDRPARTAQQRGARVLAEDSAFPGKPGAGTGASLQPPATQWISRDK